MTVFLVAIGDSPAGRSLKSYILVYVYTFDLRAKQCDLMGSHIFPLKVSDFGYHSIVATPNIDSIFDDMITMDRQALSNISNNPKAKITTVGKRKKQNRTGRWEKNERIAFLIGFRIHGKGNWKEIAQMIPNR